MVRKPPIVDHRPAATARRVAAAALFLSIAAWRLFECIPPAVAEMSPEHLAIFGWSLDERGRHTLGPDWDLCAAARRHVPTTSLLVLFTAVDERPRAARNRMTLLLHRLLSLLYPLRISICFGDVPGAEAFLRRLDQSVYLANVTPDRPFPLMDWFEPIDRGPNHSLWRFRGAP